MVDVCNNGHVANVLAHRFAASSSSGRCCMGGRQAQGRHAIGIISTVKEKGLFSLPAV